MSRLLLASAAALGLMINAGMAADTTSETTTTTSAPPPVWITTNSRITTEAQRTPGGVTTLTSGVTSHDTNGSVAGATNSTRSYPLSNVITTTQKKIETVNGVPMETVTTTNSYPGGTAKPVTTVTQTPVSDTK